MILNPYRFSLGAAPLYLSGTHFLSQPIDGDLPAGSTLLIDVVPTSLPPTSGTSSDVQYLLRNPYDTGFNTSSPPSIRIFPNLGLGFNGLCCIRGSAPQQSYDLLVRAALSNNTRYQIIAAGSSPNKFYVNGVLRQEVSDSLPFRRQTHICGYPTAATCFRGEFIQFAMFSSSLTQSQSESLYANPNYDLSTIPGITDWWVGKDINNGVIPNRISGGPSLTLVAKS